MDRDEVRSRIFGKIDEQAEALHGVYGEIYRHPELGYQERFATDFMADKLEALGLAVEKDIAVTGCRAVSARKKPGPTIAVMGELDALFCPDHPDSDKDGVIHACGHNIQLAAMYGAALGLRASGILDELDGNVQFIAVPAEEFIQLEYRSRLIEEGKIRFFGGKQELIRRGLLDDVDMVMMIHSIDLSAANKRVVVNPQGNGFIGKRIRFIGRESHAGAAPDKGVNALNAAVLAINNIHAQRETFPESERVRVHPIITKGGDVVNIVPADVRMESYVRARTLGGIVDANKKVNRSLRAAAIAMGAQVRITEIPGYMPLLPSKELGEIFARNLMENMEESLIQDSLEIGGSFDIGDLSHIMPVLHPLFGGVKGALHTREFSLVDPDLAYVLPAKLMAMTVYDLLSGGADLAKRVLSGFKPAMTKAQYLAFQDDVSKEIVEGEVP